MRISIITVAFNSAATIRDTIESVWAQTHPDVEYIVIDGGSTDGTVEIVKEYGSRIDKFVSEPDRGLYDAMNKGLALAEGDVVGILNSDDFFETDDTLAAVARKFQSAPECDLVFGDIVQVRPDDLRRVVRHYAAGHFRPWKLRFGWMPPHPATYIKKAAYDKVGKYSTDYRGAADYEMLVRLLLRHKMTPERINRVLVRMRLGGVSTSGVKAILRQNIENVRACKSNGVYTNLLFMLSKMPFKLLELFRRPELGEATQSS